MNIRPLDTSRDFPRVAALLSVAKSEPLTPEQVAEWESESPEGVISQRLVWLDAAGEIQGHASVQRSPWEEAGQFWLRNVVAPGLRGRGIGSQLYAATLDFAQRHDARVVEALVRDNDPASLRFAQARGFGVRRHVFESRLDLATFDERALAGVVERAEAGGIRFFSLADLGDTEEARRRLHAINSAWVRDIPGRTSQYQPFEQFVSNVCGASWYRPAGQLVAADGDRWVGMAAVGYFAHTNSAHNMFTGVDPAYRGRHLALALKALAIRFARSLGAGYITTNNDSENAPMLAVNQRLGYVRQAGDYLVSLTLPEHAEHK